MNGYVKRTVLFVAAALFIVLGIAGLVLPFLQGLLFILVGLILLSIASTTARSWIEHHTRKFPRVHSLFEKIEKRIESIIGTV